MGLAMVHGIVKSYGGKISVDSKPGQGALFRIYLPVTRKRQGAPPISVRERSSQGQNGSYLWTMKPP